MKDLRVPCALGIFGTRGLEKDMSMKNRIACSLLLLACASPAFAVQDNDRLSRVGNGSSTKDLLPQADRAQAESWMRSFAQCAVRADGASVRSLMATSAGSPEEKALLTRISTRDRACLGKGQLKFKNSMMRGALAEQLYLQAYPAPIATAAALDAALPPAEQGQGAYHAYADCVVTRNAPAADAMLRAKPGTVDEKTAIRQSLPTLSSCLAGGDSTKLAIDRVVLRGYLAEALYSKRQTG